MTRTWDDAMGEISGFGGSYERGCRAMVLAGIAWVDEHPDANPRYRGLKDVFGLAIEDNADAQALDKAIMDARTTMDDGREVRCGDEATGAMHHAAIQHVFAYKRLGWEQYRQELVDREKKEPEDGDGA